MNKKIYESPDGGKTVYARDIGHLPGSVNVKLAERKLKLEELRFKLDEQWYRDQYPELNELWQQYRTLLALLKDGPRDDYM